MDKFSDKLFNFLENSIKLKEIKRSGWIRKEIENPESIADHSYFVSLMAMLCSKELELNQEKSIKLALIHDIQEAICGDLISYGPNSEISVEKKKNLENKAFLELVGVFENKNELIELFNELNENTTLEAKLVNDLDVLEMVFQALVYEKEQKKDLTQFFKYTKTRIKTDFGIKFYNKIISKNKH